MWLVDPGDRRGMAEVIEQLAQAKLAGSPLSFDRSSLAEQLSYERRADEFASVVRAGIERRQGDAGG